MSAMKERNFSRKQQASGKRLSLLTNCIGVDTKKFTKKDLEEACRKQNDTIPSLNKKKAVTNLDAVGDVVSQVKVLDAGVKQCARKFNEAKAHGNKLEEELSRKLDEHAELSREASALEDMIDGNNPEAKRITKLSKEIEETNENSEMKLHYRLKLNHMLQRLRKNSISLDAHMSAMSDTLTAADKEKRKCVKMLGEVDSGHTMALRELEATSRNVEVERAQRKRALNNRKLEASNVETIEAWRNERESSRLLFEQSLGGANNREKEKKLRWIKDRQAELEQLQAATEAKTGKLGTLEEAFTHIKQATGANTLTEMVDKFTNHQEHRDRLLVEKKEAEEKLNSAKKSFVLTLEKYNEVKADGFGNTELNREIINELNETIMKEKTEGKVVKSTNVRLEGVLVGLRQGGMGLYQRLLPFHPTLLDGEAPQLSESETASAIQAANDTLEMLKVTEEILGKMLDAVGGVEGVKNRSVIPENAISELTKVGDIIDGFKTNVDTLENPNLGDNNCRIKPKKDSHSSDEEDGDDDSEEYCDDFFVIDDTEPVENMVPSRNFLKTSSDQQAEEARRQAELEEKQRKIREKAMSGDNLKNGSLAMKRRQQEADERMAQHSLPVGLPKSVTIRDDPLTKAKAFFTEMPYLE